jgi:hypothetical protein
MGVTPEIGTSQNGNLLLQALIIKYARHVSGITFIMLQDQNQKVGKPNNSKFWDKTKIKGI